MRRTPIKWTTEKLREHLKQAAQSELFMFDKVEWVNSKTKVTATCKLHGDWVALPHSLLKGTGCPACGMAKTHRAKYLDLKPLLARCVEVHDGKYAYTSIPERLIKQEEPVPIICPIHGVFYQSLKNHKRGHGCPACANRHSQRVGFSRSEWCAASRGRLGGLYIVDFPDLGFVKIGISYDKPQRRLRRWKTYGNLEIILSLWATPSAIFDAEHAIHRKYAKYRNTYEPMRGNGGGECFALPPLVKLNCVAYARSLLETP